MKVTLKQIESSLKNDLSNFYGSKKMYNLIHLCKEKAEKECTNKKDIQRHIQSQIKRNAVIQKQIIDDINEMLLMSHKHMISNCERIINSMHADWECQVKSKLLPKSILVALLDNESRQWSAKGTHFENESKKLIEKIKTYYLHL